MEGQVVRLAAVRKCEVLIQIFSLFLCVCIEQYMDFLLSSWLLPLLITTTTARVRTFAIIVVVVVIIFSHFFLWSHYPTYFSIDYPVLYFTYLVNYTFKYACLAGPRGSIKDGGVSHSQGRA